MNPEEGELRPQLLDRFGLTVEVRASREPKERAEVVRRRLAFEADPTAFAARWADAEAGLAGRIAAARKRLGGVRLPDERLEQIAAVCAGFEVDGLRADLVTANAALAHAAWRGRDVVTADDVRAAARLSLPHRRRRDPFDAPGLDESLLDELLDSTSPDDDDPPPDDGTPPPDDTAQESGTPQGDETGRGNGTAKRNDTPRGNGTARESGTPQQDDTGRGGGDPPDETSGRDATPGEGGAAGEQAADQAGGRGGGERVAVAAAPHAVPTLEVPGVGDGVAGRRSRARTARGRVTGARRPAGKVRDPHVPATLLAAAPHQRARGRDGAGLVLRADDLREAVREGREGNLVLFVVDASGSMAARRRMTTVKTAVLSLLLDAYQRRDKVGLITFRGRTADLVLPPTSSVEAGAARLRALPTGGRTPLAAGLVRAAEVLRAERLRDPARRPLLVVVTDGRATAGGDVDRAAGLLAGTAGIVVDCESGPVRLGLAGRLASRLGARLVPLDDLGGAVRAHRKAA
jgi:magnesium chelatase subunit D